MSSGAVIGTKGVPRAEREGQIIATAISEFGVYGYAGASMIEIARRAGISKPLIYQYFGSKDGLYLACLHDVSSGMLQRLEQAELDVDDSVASRIHPLRAVFEALEPEPHAWRMLFDPTMPTTGEIAVAAGEYRARTTELAASGSARFLQARGIGSALDASALTSVWMGVVNSLVEWWLDHPDESAQHMIERCHRLLGAILD
jgi:AcrR family transcriptional regulator